VAPEVPKDLLKPEICIRSFKTRRLIWLYFFNGERWNDSLGMPNYLILFQPSSQSSNAQFWLNRMQIYILRSTIYNLITNKISCKLLVFRRIFRVPYALHSLHCHVLDELEYW